MEHIRPHQLLALGDDFGKPYTAFMPPNYAGGIMALESVLMVKLLNLFNPLRLFEFGTYRGDTTRLLLENADPAAKLVTLDLQNVGGVRFQGNDGDLARNAVSSEPNYRKSARASNVVQLLMDSRHFNPEPYAEQMQFVFIDANHELEYVQRDTRSALTMLAPENSVLVWHDYGNKQFPELTAYLDSLPLPLYHIEETMLAIYPRGLSIPPRSTGIHFAK